MIYPPVKRAYSPLPSITKDLSHLTNINAKFTGTGGCKSFFYLVSSSLAPKKQQSVPKPVISGIYK
jgi:hypothetical protein